jgi:putative addiction module component (TIGR02574 family)
MSDRTKSVLEAALKLPPNDRSFIIDQLAKTLPPSPIDVMSDEELEVELDRRATEFARDSSVATPWKEFDWDAVE